MLAAGRSTPEIAIALHISNLTARNHIQNILHKLEVHSKSEAVAFAFQKRLKLVGTLPRGASPVGRARWRPRTEADW